MNEILTPKSKDELKRLSRFGGIIGLVIGIVSAAVGLAINSRLFLFSYLEGYLLCLGITLGCLSVWMIHSLVGGQWGDPIDGILQSGAKMLPLMALLFLPILIGMDRLFPWTDSVKMHANEMLKQKTWWLNRPFFIGRAIFYLGLWNFLLWGLDQRSKRATKDPINPWTLKVQNWSGGGLLALFLSASFALVDWVISLEPFFYSTIWGPLVLMGMLLGTFSFLTFAAIQFHGVESRHGATEELNPIKLNDLGNLCLMSIILWMYMTFCQYLIIWSGQIKAEISWYNARFIGGWEWYGFVLLAFGFVVPFFLLLFRAIKRVPQRLAVVTGMILVVQWFWMVWLIGPSLSPMHIEISWMTFTLPMALGLVWLGAFLWKLSQGEAPLPFAHEAEVKQYAA